MPSAGLHKLLLVTTCLLLALLQAARGAEHQQIRKLLQSSSSGYTLASSNSSPSLTLSASSSSPQAALQAPASLPSVAFSNNSGSPVLSPGPTTNLESATVTSPEQEEETLNSPSGLDTSDSTLGGNDSTSIAPAPAASDVAVQGTGSGPGAESSQMLAGGPPLSAETTLMAGSGDR